MIRDHFGDRYTRFDGPGVMESRETAQKTGEMEQAGQKWAQGIDLAIGSEEGACEHWRELRCLEIEMLKSHLYTFSSILYTDVSHSSIHRLYLKATM